MTTALAGDLNLRTRETVPSATPTPTRVRELPAPRALPRPLLGPPAERDVVDEWGVQSFPASDPPANW